MHIFVCLDQKNGMMFFGKRQSKDRFLRAHMLKSIGASSLWMNSYSAGQFEDLTAQICISEAFLEKAQKGEYCFVEDQNIWCWAPLIEDIIVYRWNRVYPADLFFPEKLLSGRKMVHSEVFTGYSHDEIIREVYVL